MIPNAQVLEDKAENKNKTFRRFLVAPVMVKIFELRDER